MKYPVYIVSKGRWENPLTAKCFLKNNVDFLIAVEPQEYEEYCKVIPSNNILKLPFSNLGLGSYPARNYCWEHSIENGHKKHWIFDDNIRGFEKLIKGVRVPKADPSLCINSLEELTDKFSKIALSGFNYSMFVNKKTVKAFTINTHVYSAILINNEIPFRWRLKYNEDVDLCLQALHDGWNTILLNAFVVQKTSTTQKMKGGNQTELYKGNAFEKKVLKAKSLELVWPQYVKTVIRFNRPHHQVLWKKHFKHGLVRV